MTTSHNLGFPRIGAKRELKRALEAYWNKTASYDVLQAVGKKLRQKHWQLQADAGLDYLPVGDFSWYDHVLDTSVLFGVVPERFGNVTDEVSLDQYFCIARGQAPDGREAVPSALLKWFDTNYHYIVPEFSERQTFRISSNQLFSAVDDAITLGYPVKPVLLGPLSFLWLGKSQGHVFDKLTLLHHLLACYVDVLNRLADKGIEWVQIDEPILVLDLPPAWKEAFLDAYQALSNVSVKLLLTTYFGSLGDHQTLACQLPTAGLHVDLCSAPQSLDAIVQHYPPDRVLSLGVVNGRNIWRNDLSHSLNLLSAAHQRFRDRLWLAPSCSLLHVPVDLDQEKRLDPELKNWLAFAKQKIKEVTTLSHYLNGQKDRVLEAISDSDQAAASRRQSKHIHSQAVKDRISTVSIRDEQRQSPYSERCKLQQQSLNLPLLPTTTIGSFPQTTEIREIRRKFRRGDLPYSAYQQKIKHEIAQTIKKQEDIDLDVLVHGEAERNDMVEYFGELLNGFDFTQYGWVQSFGSRYVKPPIIYGDVSRSHAMTTEWSAYAQSITTKPVKGMLTGPVTILAWSFVRDDQPAETTALQIALALRDEVKDLETAGLNVIQIDEPAIREKLPLRHRDWDAYLKWASRCFRVAAGAARDKTQIHTHMCYSEFNDIIETIAALDADVITVESSRSDMQLLKAFDDFDYPNAIGPGVYDIHSPRIPGVEEIVGRLEKILHYIDVDKLWVNPDCGLKTRHWKELQPSLENLVLAAQLMRAKHTLINRSHYVDIESIS